MTPRHQHTLTGATLADLANSAKELYDALTGNQLAAPPQLPAAPTEETPAKQPEPAAEPEVAAPVKPVTAPKPAPAAAPAKPAPTPAVKPAPAKPTAPAAAPAAPADPSITVDSLRKKVVALVKAAKGNAVKDLLAKFGLANLSAMTPEQLKAHGSEINQELDTLLK